MTRVAGCVVLVLCTICGGIPAQSIEVAFELPPQGVSFGEPFAVTVERRWVGGGELEPFDDKALAPLSVVLEDRVVGPPHGHATWLAWERRRYRARAYVVGEVRLPAIEFRYLDRVATCTPAPFVVRSVLPEPPGDIEWPGDVREWPQGSWRWWLAVVMAALLVGVWWWRRPAPRAVSPASIPAPPPHELTLAQLKALSLPERDAAVEAFYAELAEILRGHVLRRFSVPSAVRTSQEILAAVRIGTAELQPCLLACDFVKFGACRPAKEEHAVALQQAEAFVKATIGEVPAP